MIRYLSLFSLSAIMSVFLFLSIRANVTFLSSNICLSLYSSMRISISLFVQIFLLFIPLSNVVQLCISFHLCLCLFVNLNFSLSFLLCVCLIPHLYSLVWLLVHFAFVYTIYRRFLIHPGVNLRLIIPNKLKVDN